MAGRVAAVEQLRHADRLKTVGRLASGVAHELGTPLNVIAGRAGMISSGRLSPTEAAQSAEIIRNQSQQMTQIIRQLLDFSRQNSPRRVAVDLSSVIRQTVGLLMPLAEKREVTIEADDVSTGLVGRIDVGQIQQVLSNLLINAIQAMPSGGVVKIVARRRGLKPGESGPLADSSDDEAATEYLVITIEDEGGGITEEHLDHLFEPFFTTKDVGEGTGLGLSISYGIVQEHGGWIDVQSDVGSGSIFAVYLPAELQTDSASAPSTGRESTG